LFRIAEHESPTSQGERFITDSEALETWIVMSRRLKELSPRDFERLPTIAEDHFCIGEEWIYLHLWNRKKMNWYLAEYGPINRRFFGFFENKSDGIASGFCTIEELLSLEKRGEAWEVLVDEDWKPTVAKEIATLKGYINMMRSPPDIM
jgi:hypothetical protein